MIRVIDRTITCIEAYEPGEKTLRELAMLLFKSGADFLEVTPASYAGLEGAVPNAKYIMRVQHPDDAENYLSRKDIRRFVCPGQSDSGLQVYPEIRLNDIREFFTILRHKDCDRVRVRGLADAILQHVDIVFHNLRSEFSGKIEFSPENDCYSATSMAVEWAITGGTDVVTSFFGMDNMAAFEDVTRALFFLKGRNAKNGIAALDQSETLLRQLLFGSDRL